MGKKKSNHSWERVKSTPPNPKELERRILNKNVFEDPKFKEACKNADIKPTLRQASKFVRRKGLAYTTGIRGKNEVR